MELRHLRCFLVVAEELHFARAAERLHIEQSPLSRAIKELEEELGVGLFARTTRSTRLTRAGALFLEHVPRVFTALQQARDSVKAAANGFHSQLRIALSDGITPSRLPTLLALCRQEEPEVEIRLFEVPLSQQLKGLHDDLYDVGLAQSDEVGNSIVAEPAWRDELMVAVPARHGLLRYKRIPLEEVLRFPLVLGDPKACEGHSRQIERVLRRADIEPLVADRVASFDLMMTLVSAGSGEHETSDVVRLVVVQRVPLMDVRHEVEHSRPKSIDVDGGFFRPFVVHGVFAWQRRKLAGQTRCVAFGECAEAGAAARTDLVPSACSLTEAKRSKPRSTSVHRLWLPVRTRTLAAGVALEVVHRTLGHGSLGATSICVSPERPPLRREALKYHARFARDARVCRRLFLNQETITILDPGNPCRRLASTAPGRTGFRMPIFRCDRRGSLTAALASENILCRQTVFGDLFADLRYDSGEFLLAQCFSFLLQLFEFRFRLCIGADGFWHRV